MAEPFREGAAWAFRITVHGERHYRSGFKTKLSAQEAAVALRHSLRGGGAPDGDGPTRTTLAQLLTRYGSERLAFLKAGKQDADRINRFLRAASAPTLSLQKVDTHASGVSRCWSVGFAPAAAPRKIPRGLAGHRAAQTARAETSDALRRRLALTPVSRITPLMLQALFDAQLVEGRQPATLQREHALLRQAFNHAIRAWAWAEIQVNPATLVTLPRVDNARDRVLSNAEWARIAPHLAAYDNPYALPGIRLLLETAMRSSEPLLHARWRDVDEVRCLLHLRDSKSGARAVPLSATALEVIAELRALAGQAGRDGRLLPTTYNALKKAWTVACTKAGIDDVRLHDLRHTCATRYAMEFRDLSSVMLVTGHKTPSQALRYVNLTADDVARRMHNRPLPHAHAPAGLTHEALARMQRQEQWKDQSAPPLVPPLVPTLVDAPPATPASNVVPFPARRAA